jgi:hypothetical protein
VAPGFVGARLLPAARRVAGRVRGARLPTRGGDAASPDAAALQEQLRALSARLDEREADALTREQALRQALDGIHHELVSIRQWVRADGVRRLLERFDPESPALTRHELGAFSQNGEDGVLLEILARIGLRHGSFAEIGASSAQSNCILLCDVLGWGGLFADASAEEHAALERKYRHRPDVRTVHARVTRQNVTALLRDAGVPADVTVLSIDIDGNDYWVWEGLEGYRPAVVIIEHNASLDPRRCLVQPYDPDRRWDGSAFFGASLGALRRLGASRGYRLVAVELTGTNAFLVREDLAQPFAAEVAPRAANYLLSGMTHPEPGEPAGYLDLEAGVPGPG